MLEEKRTKNRAAYQDPSSPSHYCLLHAWIWTLGLQRKGSFQSVFTPLTGLALSMSQTLGTAGSLLKKTEEPKIK